MDSNKQKITWKFMDAIFKYANTKKEGTGLKLFKIKLIRLELELGNKN